MGEGDPQYIKTVRFAIVLVVSAAWAAPLDVRDFGARGDGAAKDTAAIQKGIDAAERNGGGTVVVPAGRYLSGTIHLKSNVTLHLENGATILGSPDEADYDPYEKLPFQSVSDNETTYFHYALVAAENAHDIAITGEGAIDGNRTKRGGPKTIAIKLCERVTIRGITVRNSPNYSISLWGSDYVTIDGVTILNGYADGIDPDACRYVRIANCFIDSHDDAICPKASPSMGMERKRAVEHLVVTNSIVRTDSNGFKFGTESSGDLRDVAVTNLTVGPREGRPGSRPRSGISLESVDGARIEGVVISNVEMADVETPVFIRLGNRGRGMAEARPGSIENVLVRGVVVRGASMPSSVTGLPGAPVRRVTLDGMMLAMDGGAREARKIDVPELPAKYPEGRMFGELPAYALYARHVEGLTLIGIQPRTLREDARPAAVFDDVRELSVFASPGIPSK
jgi:polygalacturonase